MAFDPTLDPVVGQTVQGVTANNLKTYGHFMDNIVHESAKDLLEEGRLSRSLARQSGHALGARVVESILGRQIEDAASDAIEANAGIAANVQTDATAVVSAFAQISSQLQQALTQQAATQQQMLLALMSVLQQSSVGTPAAVAK